MLHKFKKRFQCIVVAKRLCLLYHYGYLKDVGWCELERKGSSIDKMGNSIPWITYPAMDFLKTRLNKDIGFFEYFCENSTLWLAKRVKAVSSCEHSKSWFEKTNELKPKNVTLLFKKLEYDGNHSKEILNYQDRFDIIIIDGKDRVKCVKKSLNALKEKGVIVWDNSDREEYREGYDSLKEKGFKKIDFWGIGPIAPIISCTSVFYRREKCLDI